MASNGATLSLGAGHTAGIYSDMTVDGPIIGDLVVIVDKGKNLPNRKTMGKQDPYCAARLGKEAKKTTTDKRGGQTPRWDQELRFTVHDSPDYYHLKVSVFNDDKKTDLIGETRINLQDVVVPGGGQNDLWHSLNCKGKYAGEIRIEITYYDTRPKDESLTEKRRETNNSRGALNEMTRESVGGPRQPSPMKRRPLPEDPTLSNSASSPSVSLENGYPGYSTHTPPRSLREGGVPNSRHSIYNESPHSASQLRYSQPPPTNSHSYVDSPFETPSFPSRQQPTSQYYSEHDIDYEQTSNHPQGSSIDLSLAGPDGPPPPPPAHSDRHTSPGISGISRPIQASPHSNSTSPAFLQQQPLESRNRSPRWQEPREDYPTGSADYQQDHYGHNSYDNAYMQPSIEDEEEYLPPNLRHRTSQGQQGLISHDPRANGFSQRDSFGSTQLSYERDLQRQPEIGQTNSGSPSPLPSSLLPGYDPRLAPRVAPSRQDPSARSSISSAPVTPLRTSTSHGIIERQQLGSSPTKPSPLREDSWVHQPSAQSTTRRSVSPDTRISARKSVSPSPYSTPGGEKRLSGIPFSPDSYDALNPNAGSSPPQAAPYNTPEQAREVARQNLLEAKRGPAAPIRKSDGRIIDPSDHLPTDTWAPEPVRKGPAKSSSYTETSTRPSPGGAQPMPNMARRNLRDSGVRPLSNPTPIYAHSSEPQSPLNYGRNRLQKKSKGSPSPPRGTASSPYSFSSPGEASSRSLPPSPLERPLRERENYGYGSSPGYGSRDSGARNSPAGPPPVPAKVPMEGYDKLSEEMKRIDIGSGRRRIRY